jgi:hypothetical protein
MHIVREHLPQDRYELEKQLRYSRSKMGANNPMLGKSGSQHHNYIGDCEDQKGYLTRVVNGKRIFAHHAVMMEALGLPRIPKGLHIHHINGDTRDNRLDNLALVTHKAHGALHGLRLKYEKSPMWVKWVSGISKSRGITAT